MKIEGFLFVRLKIMIIFVKKYKDMKLNSNSISSKLYRWFYGTNDLPNNLCPYFWKLVLSWLVLIPYSLFCLPVILHELFDKTYRFTDNSTGKRIGYSSLTYALLFFIGCMLSSIGWFFIEPEKDSFYQFMGTLGFVIWVVSIIIGIVEGFKAFKEWNYSRKIKYDENGRRIWNQPKEEKTYLVVEFAKAKYNKYCPKIDWIDKK
jgi:hypothetical protein